MDTGVDREEPLIAPDRLPVDMAAYALRTAETCFVCAFLAADPEYRHETVYEDTPTSHSSVGTKHPPALAHAPLPSGVPYGRQQFHLLMIENGVLDMSPAAMTDLARRIRQAINA